MASGDPERTASSRSRSDAQGQRGALVAGRPAERPTESSTSSRVCGSTVSTSRAPEVGEGVVDGGDVDGADRAEVLGDDEVGVEVRQGARVEAVEVLPAAHRRATASSISRGVEPLGSVVDDTTGGSGPPPGWSHSNVTPDDVVTGADREEDLGGRRDAG